MNELGSEETTTKSFPYADLAMSTSIRMENLVLQQIPVQLLVDRLQPVLGSP